jgi:hypothetical protein
VVALIRLPCGGGAAGALAVPGGAAGAAELGGGANGFGAGGTAGVAGFGAKPEEPLATAERRALAAALAFLAGALAGARSAARRLFCC